MPIDTMNRLTSTPPPSEKHCHACGRLQPIDRFRRYRKGQDWPRHNDCNACRNRKERDQRRRRRLRGTREKLDHLAGEQNIKRIGATVEAMQTACGGVQRIAEDVAELIRTGSPTVRSRLYQGLMTLHMAHDESQAREAERRRQDSVALADAAQNQALIVTSEQLLRELPPQQLRPIVERLNQRLERSEPMDEVRTGCPA